MISAIIRTSANDRSGSVADRESTVLNFARVAIRANSAIRAGELTRSVRPARTCSKPSCGAPRQSNPDSSTFVSRTDRTVPPLGPIGLHLSVDLRHRHLGDAGSGNAIGNAEQ